jgi:hypothetical protein
MPISGCRTDIALASDYLPPVVHFSGMSGLTNSVRSLGAIRTLRIDLDCLRRLRQSMIVSLRLIWAIGSFGGVMFRYIALTFLFIVCFATPGLADQIVCPTQKQPSCNDLLPPQPMICDRNSCNVVMSSSGGRNSCLWTCAAHFEGLSVNGVPVDSLFDALKKSQKQ